MAHTTATLKVRDLMHAGLESVRADATLGAALETLADARVSGLPVVDTHGMLVGVLSTKDVLAALAEAGDAEARARGLEETSVRDVMTPRPETIAPDAEVLDAARRMLYLEVRRLFVEERGNLIGVITQTDIVGGLAAGRI